MKPVNTALIAGGLALLAAAAAVLIVRDSVRKAVGTGVTVPVSAAPAPGTPSAADLKKLVSTPGECEFGSKDAWCTDDATHVLSWKCECPPPQGRTMGICDLHLEVLKIIRLPFHSLCGSDINWAEV